MSELSFTINNLTISDASQSAEQILGSIQPFQNWIEKVEIRKNLATGSSRSHHEIEKRNSSFTNGPYVEIKESIGKYLRHKAA